MTQRVLIMGANGALGRQLHKDFSNLPKFSVKGTARSKNSENLLHLDLTYDWEVKNTLNLHNPDIIIIPAAKTNVAECEKSPSETYAINVGGIENIVANTNPNQKLVFLSTDSLFDGTQNPYSENGTPNPINVYARSKFFAEEVLRDRPNILIVRSSRFYGALKSKKFLDKVVEKLSSNEQVLAPKDTPGNFTFIPDVSMAIIKLVSQGAEGVYNVTGPDVYSLYSAAMLTADIFGLDKNLIKPVNRDYFDNDVKRASVVLDTTKLKNEGIFMIPLPEGLSLWRKLKNAR